MHLLATNQYRFSVAVCVYSSRKVDFYGTKKHDTSGFDLYIHKLAGEQIPRFARLKNTDINVLFLKFC